jgi:hypothetical protein
MLIDGKSNGRRYVGGGEKAKGLNASPKIFYLILFMTISRSIHLRIRNILF